MCRLRIRYPNKLWKYTVQRPHHVPAVNSPTWRRHICAPCIRCIPILKPCKTFILRPSRFVNAAIRRNGGTWWIPVGMLLPKHPKKYVRCLFCCWVYTDSKDRMTILYLFAKALSVSGISGILSMWNILLFSRPFVGRGGEPRPCKPSLTVLPDCL